MLTLKFDFVAGSSGKLDYLVIARSGRCAIAIKPEIAMPKPNFAVYGVRLRVCADPKADFRKHALSPQEIKAAAHPVPLRSVDAVRGSVEILTTENGKGDSVKFIEDISTDRPTAMKIVGLLKQALSPTKLTLLHTDEVIGSFISEGWYETHIESLSKFKGIDEEKVKEAALAAMENAFKHGGQEPA